MRTDERDRAFSEFVAARRTHLRRIAYAICGDWHRADDLVQTALVKLYVAWPRLHRDGREEAYVRTIIVRANIDEHRKPWRRERSGLPDQERPAREPLPVEERSALFDALQALPTMQRKVVVLRHWLGLSVAETAQRRRGRGAPNIDEHRRPWRRERAAPRRGRRAEPCRSRSARLFEASRRCRDAAQGRGAATLARLSVAETAQSCGSPRAPSRATAPALSQHSVGCSPPRSRNLATSHPPGASEGRAVAVARLDERCFSWPSVRVRSASSPPPSLSGLILAPSGAGAAPGGRSTDGRLVSPVRRGQAPGHL